MRVWECLPTLCCMKWHKTKKKWFANVICWHLKSPSCFHLHLNFCSEFRFFSHTPTFCLWLFFFCVSLGVFAKTVAYSGAPAPTIKSSSNSVWHVVLPFRMEKGTAPGISCASITHCQDWRRLLCQNNDVDIQQKRPLPPQPIFSPFHPLLTFNHLPNVMHVCPWILPSPSRICHHRSLSLLYAASVSWLAMGFPFRGWTNCLLLSIPSFLHPLFLSSSLQPDFHACTQVFQCRVKWNTVEEFFNNCWSTIKKKYLNALLAHIFLNKNI